MKRKKPYAPSFSVIAASTIEPPVGASTCASGNQVCTGNIGTFTANDRKKAANRICWVNNGICLMFWKSSIAKLPPVCSDKYTKATNISNEPISV